MKRNKKKKHGLLTEIIMGLIFLFGVYMVMTIDPCAPYGGPRSLMWFCIIVGSGGYIISKHIDTISKWLGL